MQKKITYTSLFKQLENRYNTCECLAQFLAPDHDLNDPFNGNIGVLLLDPLKEILKLTQFHKHLQGVQCLVVVLFHCMLSLMLYEPFLGCVLHLPAQQTDVVSQFYFTVHFFVSKFHSPRFQEIFVQRRLFPVDRPEQVFEIFFAFFTILFGEHSQSVFKRRYAFT